MSHPSQEIPFLPPSTMADVTLTKGSKVEVSTDEPEFYGAWYEATLVDVVPLPTKKGQKKKMGYLVQYDTLFSEDNLEERLSENVDPVFVRPLPPKNVGNDDVDEFEVMDVVDCYRRDGWWYGIVDSVIVDFESGQKTYLVKFENPVEIFECKNSQMRPHFDWFDSSWKLAPKKTQEQDVADKYAIPKSESNVDAQSFTSPSKRPPAGNLRIKAESNSEMDGVVDGSVMTSRKRSTMNSAEVSSSKKTRSLADVENSDNQEARTRSSSALIPATIVENSGTTEYHTSWPFVKRSPIWAAIESHELYQKTRVKPHFAPLKNVREDCREGLAIAHMVTYAYVTKTISDLQLNDPINTIKNSLDTLAELETHGFNVGAMQAHLNELCVCKLKVSQLEEKVNLFEKDLEKLSGEKPILEKKIKDLQEKLSENVAVKIMNDDEIEKLQSNMLLATNQIKEWEVAFEKNAARRF